MTRSHALRLGGVALVLSAVLLSACPPPPWVWRERHEERRERGERKERDERKERHQGERHEKHGRGERHER